MKTQIKAIRIAALTSVCIGMFAAGSAQAQEAAPAPAPQSAEPEDSGVEIVVTARLRNERLMETPVAVTALGGEDIARYNAVDLTKIGELTPTVIVSSTRSTGSGSIAIRGISSPATNQGFEQAVSVAIDGVQSSSGRVSSLGFFDVQQVEVMKGPQTLFFGKNSPAGVIAITTAGPTDQIEVGGRVSYEFVADEITGEGYIAGPIAEGLGGRVAVKYRKMEGWLHNNALRAPNPFFPASLPATLGTLPGRQSERVGDDEIMGRITLQFEPTDNFTVTAKVFGTRGHDQGAGAYAQNIGPCSDGKPRSFGVPDPYGDCKADNQISYGDLVPVVAGALARGENNGRARGRQSAYIASLNMQLDLGNVSITSITGRMQHSYKSVAGLTQTNDSGLIVLEDTSYRSFSQELRFATSFDGPINGMIGLYYQDTRDDLYNDAVFRADISYQSATGRFDTYEKLAYLTGRTYSAFGQLSWEIVPSLELSGGLRWTSEKKSTRNQNLYGINSALGAFNTSATVFPGSSDPTPGILAGEFSDDNLSPEVTLSWHPVADTTIYASYRTGYKSGGFGITSPIQTNATLGDIDFDSETVSGGEIGAKGEFFNRRVRMTASAFYYDFKNLQVTTYDAAAIRYKINNAGLVRQRGFEIEGDFRVTPNLKIRGAFAYVNNRISGYTGQCYGYSIPVAQALTAAAPPGCSFVLNPNGTRFQTGTGAAVLQQVFDGRAPARSPDWSGNIGFDANFPTGGGKEITLTGDGFYSSSYYASDSYSPAALQRAFWRFNASVRFGDEQGRWQFALVGRNLTNKYYLLFAGDRTGGASVPLTLGEQRASVARGREIAAQVSFKF
ncbi:TonB-dependent receptor [Sphingomonas sp. AOB5]|uniref:TonB-dependent receptor n=1 Tax=Sphingomonas sp. AOB5 TaxID=3034017 RepID=UPI0023F96A32|nr:TonB-dependent receptor [Sphingomonas sp. AOB5]MDF7774825.1 TonB-dependent receptor [Sphingomonas sp. AOB5]